MKYSEIKDLIEKNAPDSGYVLAYTRKKLIFKIYSDKNSLEGIFEGECSDFLEIHLFNSDSEYRILSSESSRYESGFVAHLAEFTSDIDETYIQDVFLDLNKEESREIHKDKIKVLNHIAYTSEGMAFIDDYRLCID